MIEAIATCAPKNLVHTHSVPHFTEDFRERFVRSTGIECRHISEHTTEDLMIGACEMLDEVGITSIVTVTQTPEYKMPGPGFNIAKRIGIEGGAIFDLNLACDGYVKGLALAQMIATGSQGKVLLLVGDTLGSVMPASDPTVGLIFGNAASATIVTPEDPLVLITASYPQGFSHLTMKTSAYMNGEAVTNFAVTKVPEFMKDQGLIDGDIYYFHQANKTIINMLQKRLDISPNAIPISYGSYGNTSSASIPLTLCLFPPGITEKNIILCGFGAGLSISAMRIKRPDFTVYGEI